jgi:hypothetical protein
MFCVWLLDNKKGMTKTNHTQEDSLLHIIDSHQIKLPYFEEETSCRDCQRHPRLARVVKPKVFTATGWYTVA